MRLLVLRLCCAVPHFILLYFFLFRVERPTYNREAMVFACQHLSRTLVTRFYCAYAAVTRMRGMY